MPLKGSVNTQALRAIDRENESVAKSQGRRGARWPRSPEKLACDAPLNSASLSLSLSFFFSFSLSLCSLSPLSFSLSLHVE